MSEFYSYVHARPDGSIFYVGKGKGNRANHLTGRSSHHQNVINKHGAENVLIGRMACSSEAIAFDLERGLIKCLRRMGVELTNKTDGGDGVLGLAHSAETKRQLSELFNNPEYREKHRASVIAAHVREKAKYRASAKASQNREDIKEKHRAYQGSPEVVKAKSFWGKAAWADPEKAATWRAKIVASLQTEESRARKSRSLLGKNVGRVSMMRGSEHRMVHIPDIAELLADGWTRGNPSSKGRVVTRGRVWINNGSTNRMVLPEELPVLLTTGNWRRGRK